MLNANQELLIEASQKLAQRISGPNINPEYMFEMYLGILIRLYLGINCKPFKHEEINLNTNLHHGLKMNAVNKYELICLIEKGFGFNIPDEKFNKIMIDNLSIKDLCKLIIECRRDPKCHGILSKHKHRNFPIDANVMERYLNQKMRCVANEMEDFVR